MILPILGKTKKTRAFAIAFGIVASYLTLECFSRLFFNSSHKATMLMKSDPHIGGKPSKIARVKAPKDIQKATSPRCAMQEFAFANPAS